MEIDRTSRRILGALIEKRWTTPEQYPLTLNSLVPTVDASTDSFHQADSFVAWDERDGGLDGPVSARGVDVGVTEAGRSHLDEHFAPHRCCDVHVLEVKPAADFVEYKCLHVASICLSGSFTSVSIE